MTGVPHDLPLENMYYQVITDFPFITENPFTQTYPKLSVVLYMRHMHVYQYCNV
jgi:hypothetical protein